MTRVRPQAFLDPVFDLVHFDVPLGWGFVGSESTLPFIQHRLWSDPTQSLSVGVRPSPRPPTVDDQSWLSARLDLLPLDVDEARLLHQQRRVVAGGYFSSEAGRGRVVFVRGARLDVDILHQGDSRSGEVMTAAIRRVLDTVYVPANVRAPEPLPGTIRGEALALQGLMEQADPDPAELIRRGRSLLMHGWLTGDREGDWIGAWSVVHGFADFGISDITALYGAELAFARLVPGVEDDPSDEGSAAHAVELGRLSLHRRLTALPILGEYWSRLRQTLDATGQAYIGEDGTLLRPLPPSNALSSYCVGLVQAGVAESDPDAALRSLCFAGHAASSALVLSAAPSSLIGPVDPFELAALATTATVIDHLNARTFITEEDHDLHVRAYRRLLEAGGGAEDDRVGLAKALAKLVLARERRTAALEVAVSRRWVDEARGLLANSTPSALVIHQVGYAEAVVNINEGSLDDAIAVLQSLPVPAEFDRSLLDESSAGMAGLLVEAGRIDDAEAVLRNVETNSLPVLLVRAQLAGARGDVAGAIRFAADGLVLASKSEGDSRASVRGLLAAAAETLDTSLPAAAAYLISCVLEIDRTYVAEGFTNDVDRVAFGDVGEQGVIAEALVGRLLQQGLVRDAVSAADDSRGLILGRTIGVHGPEPPPLPDSPPTSTAAAPLLAEVTELRHRLRNFLYAQGYPVSAPADDLIATAVDGGRQCVLVQPSGDAVHLLIINTSGVVHHVVSPSKRSDIDDLIGQIHRLLGIRTVPRGIETAFLDDLDDTQVSWATALSRLREAVIEPISPHLADAPLVVVPHRAYALVPWAALFVHDRAEADSLDGPALSVVPSLGVLGALRSDRRSRDRPGRALVVGEPAADPTLKLSPLPGASAEAHQVAFDMREAGVLPADIQVLHGSAATEAAFRSRASPDLIHYAGHAALHSPASMPALFLAPAEHRDGLLTPAEIAEVPLDDALVVLSACETGSGDPTLDGVLGLARSFLEAGSRCVVTTLWEVDDAATAQLMKVFYPLLLGSMTQKPLAVDVALARALCKLRVDLAAGRVRTDQGVVLPDDPQLWGPFVVLGDGMYAYTKTAIGHESAPQSAPGKVGSMEQHGQ